MKKPVKVSTYGYLSAMAKAGLIPAQGKPYREPTVCHHLSRPGTMARRIDTALSLMRHVPIAEVAAVAGVSVVVLRLWADGTATPSTQELYQLAESLGLTLHFLQTGDRTGEIRTHRLTLRELTRCQ